MWEGREGRCLNWKKKKSGRKNQVLWERRESKKEEGAWEPKQRLRDTQRLLKFVEFVHLKRNRKFYLGTERMMDWYLTETEQETEENMIRN